MQEIITAIIGLIGVLGAAIITSRVTTKITNASQKAGENTVRAEALIDNLWRVIDELRLENAIVERERDMLQKENDRLKGNT